MTEPASSNHPQTSKIHLFIRRNLFYEEAVQEHRQHRQDYRRQLQDFHRHLPQPAISNNAGEGYIDTAVKVLIAVVLGALVLAGLYAVLNDTVMPTVTQRIQEMFDYAG